MNRGIQNASSPLFLKSGNPEAPGKASINKKIPFLLTFDLYRYWRALQPYFRSSSSLIKKRGCLFLKQPLLYIYR
jgi:hypothetical protein